jgi:hypothetical protein
MMPWRWAASSAFAISIANFQGLIDWEWTFSDARSETLVLDVLHYEVVGTDVVKGTDVGMVERRDHMGFGRESLREALGRNLDGNISIEARVASFVDLAHTASTDQVDDLVRA